MLQLLLRNRLGLLPRLHAAAVKAWAAAPPPAAAARPHHHHCRPQSCLLQLAAWQWRGTALPPTKHRMIGFAAVCVVQITNRWAVAAGVPVVCRLQPRRLGSWKSKGTRAQQGLCCTPCCKLT